MSSVVSFNGSSYIIPATGEVGWGSNVSNYLIAIAAGCLQKTGGSFTLSAETDFGASFGLKALYYKSRATGVASTGAIRLANAETGIVWRNALGNGDLALTVNSSNQLSFNGVPIESNSLTSAHILVGNVSNVATDVAMSGNVHIDNAGSTTIQSGVIVDSMVAAAAAIAITKIANGTANQLLGTNAGASANEWKTLSGTANQVTVTHGAGTVTLATPQNIATGSSPTFAGLTLSSPLTVANGGTGDASLTAYAVLCGGTTSTNAVQSIAAVGTTGQVLTSNGASALPTFQDVAGTGTVGSGTAGRLTLYNASTNAVTDTYVQNTKNITLAIATQASRSANLAITVPNPGNAVTTANLLLDSDTGSYTIAGAWTLSNSAGLTISPTSNQLVLGTTRTVTITAPQPATSSRTVTIPDLAASYSVVGTEGAQTVNGTKTFTAGQVVSASTNQLTLGSTQNIVLTAPAPASTVTYTIPDVGGAASFVMTAGSQTIGGAKTLSSTLTMSGATIAMGSQKITGLANGTATADVAAYGQVKAIQVVSATSTTSFSSSSTSFSNTNLAASITCSSSSNKVLVLVSSMVDNTTATDSTFYTIDRSGTNLGDTTGGFGRATSAGGATRAPVAITYLDSPASTSALTYTVQTRVDAGTGGFGITGKQSIVLIEINGV